MAPDLLSVLVNPLTLPLAVLGEGRVETAPHGD
jgi:hypothetical protein